MNFDEEILDILKLSGLSTYQAKCYILLCSHYYLTAQQIIELSGISRSRTYDALKSLVDHGWVETRDERPTSYMAVSPIHQLDRSRQELLQRFSQVSSDLQDSWESRKIIEHSPLQLLAGINEVIETNQKAIRKARTSVTLFLRFMISAEIDNLLSLLSRVKKQGVAVVVILHPEVVTSLTEEQIVQIRKVIGQLTINTLPTAPLPARVVFVDHELMLMTFRHTITTISEEELYQYYMLQVKIPEIAESMEKALRVTVNSLSDFSDSQA